MSHSLQPGGAAAPGTCVVTGGAGAIGSRLVARLLAGGARRIVVIDDLSSGYEWLLPRDPRVRLVRADVASIGSAIEPLEGACIFHLAAFFANQNSVDHPLDDLHTNGRGTLATLMYAADCRAQRVVYASAGCSIAGHGVDAPIREDMPVSLELDTPYQITKALGEFYCNYFNARVATVRCRFFNSFGPGEIPGQYRNVIPNFVWNALHGQSLTITGTGAETRDFIFVDDLVDGLVRCALADVAGQAFNLGTGRQTRIQHLAETIIERTRSTSRIDYTARRPWDHSVRREADISKARACLGFEPTVSLEAGLDKTIAWFRENMAQIAASAASR